MSTMLAVSALHRLYRTAKCCPGPRNNSPLRFTSTPTPPPPLSKELLRCRLELSEFSDVATGSKESRQAYVKTDRQTERQGSREADREIERPTDIGRGKFHLGQEACCHRYVIPYGCSKKRVTI